MGVMNRRGFLGGLVAAAGALVLPKTVEANAKEVRRYWALDGTMTRSPLIVDMWEQDFLPDPVGDMTIRMAWAEMGFRVGDMVAITDYYPPKMPGRIPRSNLYTVQKIDWDALSAHDTVSLREVVA